MHSTDEETFFHLRSINVGKGKSAINDTSYVCVQLTELDPHPCPNFALKVAAHKIFRIKCIHGLKCIF